MLSASKFATSLGLLYLILYNDSLINSLQLPMVSFNSYKFKCTQIEQVAIWSLKILTAISQNICDTYYIQMLLLFQVSYTFCKDFIAVLLKDMSSSGFGSTRALLKAFDRVIIYIETWT